MHIGQAMILTGPAGTANAIEQGNAEIDANEAAVSFNRQFTARYGDVHPRFLETSWQDAAVQSQTQHKSLFVYLHSRAHQVGLSLSLKKGAREEGGGGAPSPAAI